MPDPVSVTPPAVPPSVLRDAAGARAALHAQNAAHFRDLDDRAFTGNGDASYWMNRTEYVAFRTLAQAARSTLDLGAARTDAPAVEASNSARVADASRGIRDSAESYAQGYGDANYWFERSKSMSIQAAARTAILASACDASLAAALRPSIEAGLQAADGAHFGSGQAQYWSQRVAQEASAIKSSLGSLHPSAPAGAAPGGSPSQLQQDLESLNQRFASDVENMVFGHSGGPRDWMCRAEHVGIRGIQHAARLELRVAQEDAAAAPDVAKHAADVAQEVTSLQDAADRSAVGTGDANYWLDRTTYFARTTAARAEAVASHCDATLAPVVQPLLEEAIAKSENAAYTGSGYADYWSDRLWTTTVDVKNLFEDVRIRTQAEAAAIATPLGDATPERHAAEVDLTRQGVLADEWQKFLNGRQSSLAAAQTRMNQAAAVINPLVEQDHKIVPWMNRAGVAMVPSILGVMVSVTLQKSAPAVALPLGLACGALAVTAGIARAIMGGKHAKVMASYQPAHDQYEQAEKAARHVQQSMDYARPLAAAATTRVQTLESDLQIHRMAEAVNHEKPPAETVRVDEEVVRIGHLNIPKRHTESAAG